MRGFGFAILALLFLAVLLVGFSTHRVRVLLFREGGVFRAEVHFLFYRRLLYDTSYPVEIKKINRKNLRKNLAKLKNKKRSPRLDTPFRETLFYVRFVTALLLLLGAENIPRIHLRLNKLSFFVGSGDPMRTALLYGGLFNLYGQLLNMSESLSAVRVSEGAFSVSLLDAPFFDSDFDLSLSLPLFYYFQVFHSFVPDSERVLTALKKRRKKLKLRQK